MVIFLKFLKIVPSLISWSILKDPKQTVIKEMHCVFNHTCLFVLQVKLVHHTYSCLFGTFLCNTSQERIHHELDKQTASLWSLLQDKQFCNRLYSPSYDNQVCKGSTLYEPVYDMFVTYHNSWQLCSGTH